ncbi:MAG: division/cell wall cluster transcriptional repressor MraZ [Bacteroidetes bacterium]|nr:division/cell wall cluster transcriptional repressor MraZ [Bacteroidota bacterium]
MSQFIGEYECKIDAKGRINLPSSLRRQIPEEAGDRLVVNRGFDKCLVLYTRQEWLKETEKVSHLNAFNKRDRMFIRLFNNGATEIQVDAASRVNIPAKLLEYADLSGECVLFAYGNRIEIWSPKHYDEQLNIDPDEFSSLAEEVMSGDKGGPNE